MNNKPTLFKVANLGEPFSGKSCLDNRFLHQRFDNNAELTIGVEFGSKVLIIPNEANSKEVSVRIQVWDTLGQEKFNSLNGAYFRGASGLLLCFDLTNENSFNKCGYWLKEYLKYIEPYCLIYLVGCKLDLVQKRIISRERINEFSKLNNLKYFETSALNGSGVTELFADLAINMYKNSFENLKNIESEKIELSIQNNSTVNYCYC